MTYSIDVGCMKYIGGVMRLIVPVYLTTVVILYFSIVYLIYIYLYMYAYISINVCTCKGCET